jgi:HEPN domain-containing protein
MQPEEELVQQWLIRATRDLAVAKLIVGHSDAMREETGFHAQQTVEKCLKAFLVHHGVEFAWSHSLAYLLTICEQVEPTFARWRSSAEPMTQYAVRFRYPGSGPVPTAEQVWSSIQTAEDVLRFVLDHLPAEVHPPAPESS